MKSVILELFDIEVGCEGVFVRKYETLFNLDCIRLIRPADKDLSNGEIFISKDDYVVLRTNAGYEYFLAKEEFISKFNSRELRVTKSKSL